MTRSERNLSRIQDTLENGGDWITDWILENSDPQKDDAMLAWEDMHELQKAIETLWKRHKDYLIQITNEFKEVNDD